MLAAFAASGPLTVHAIAGTGAVYWATWSANTNGTANATAAVAASDMFSAQAISPMGRARPYRARGFGRRWNNKPVQPVPMATDIQRVGIRQFCPRDVTDYDATEPLVGG